MKTVAQILQWLITFLEEKKVGRAEPKALFQAARSTDGSRRMAEELLSRSLGMKRMEIYLDFDRPVEEEELDRLREWTKSVIQGCPLEYAVGELEFYGSQILVDSRVLIPRLETEILVDHVVKMMRLNEGAPRKVLFDVCTGSGCIGIALKKTFSNLSVVLSDLSKDALALASKNAALNQVNVEFLEGDLFAPFGERTADIIVCNPPYVSLREYFSLDQSVRDFEPKMALVGGEEGIEFYERLSKELPCFLRDQGKVFLEIGAGQGEAVKKIFSSSFWKPGRLEHDWSGKDRFFFLEKQSLSRVSFSV